MSDPFGLWQPADLLARLQTTLKTTAIKPLNGPPGTGSSEQAIGRRLVIAGQFAHGGPRLGHQPR
jgi:hypothetical protein